jgi:hypothetical protein
VQTPLPHLTRHASWRRLSLAAASLSVSLGLAATPAMAVSLEPASAPAATQATVPSAPAAPALEPGTQPASAPTPPAEAAPPSEPAPAPAPEPLPSSEPTSVPAVAPPSEPATCDGQEFSQPFLDFGDENVYTLAPGGSFDDEAAEGWELRGGAQLIDATRPDGSTGPVLDLPSKSVAVSPPVCVTLRYPTARAWASSPVGGEGAYVLVAYTGTQSEAHPRLVAQLRGSAGGWNLPSAFRIHPRLGGREESAREMRFVFIGASNSSDAQLFGLYVDPRMR